MRHKIREAHAFYGPSAAYQWMECAPSVLIETEDSDSSYSLRGSLLHDCADQALNTGDYAVPRARHRARAGEDVEFGQAEADSVQAYVDYVRSRPGILKIEIHSWFMRGLCGGTADAVLIDEANHTLEVVDYKAGFTQRAARGNYQLVIYALGCLAKYGTLYDIRKVRMTIVQPMRQEEPDCWTIKTSELENWGKRIKARVNNLEVFRAARQHGDYSPSDDRCQFCKVGKALKCEALDRAANAAATEDFSDYEREGLADPASTDAQKWEIAKLAERWVKNLRESIVSRMEAGEKVEGFKVVAGKGSRHVTDKKGLVSRLTDDGFGETDIYSEPVMVSPAQAEKLYTGKGSKAKKEALSPFFTKSEGAPVVVPETDKRPAIATADTEFADYKREEKK